VEPKPEAVEAPDVIEIPGDWATMHHMKRIKLAKMLAKTPAEVRVTDDEAVAIIEREIATRAANAA
jgi:hypothetical protein